MNLNLPFILAKLPNPELLQKTKTLVSEERRITTEILWCLHEVERRLLFAELGYSSIYEFAGKYLGYSGGSAHRRISAMRLLKGLPTEVRTQTEEKIKTGELTLTNVSLLHDFLKTEKKESQKNYTVTEKKSLLSSIENQSKRTVEKKLAAIQPAILPKEKERVITESLTQISFVADDKLLKKLNRIKELKGQAMSYPELLNEMAELMLERIDPDRKIQRKAEKSVQAEKPVLPKVAISKTLTSTSPATMLFGLAKN